MSSALAAKVEELERKRLELEETIHFPGRARGRRVGGRPRGGDTHAGWWGVRPRTWGVISIAKRGSKNRVEGADPVATFRPA